MYIFIAFDHREKCNKIGANYAQICTVALATLSQEQMVDLLKTSMTVTVTVIPPHIDGTPRR